MNRELRILYIMGYERSGSTFLQNLVATHPALLPVGEVHHLWDRGVKEAVQCGCGEYVKSCPFWRKVFRNWYGIDELDELLQKYKDANAIRRWRKWLFLQSMWTSSAQLKRSIQPYTHAIRRLYEALYEVEKGVMWIVDSSKTPVYGWVLTLMENIDLRILHLVRDPIATEASVWKRKHAGHPNYQGYWPGRAAARWAFWTWVNHHWFHKHPGYRLLAYDTLLERPRDVVQAVHRWLGLTPYLGAFETQKVVHLEPTHTFGGSPSRFRTGRVVVSPTPNPLLHSIHRKWAAFLAIPGVGVYREALLQRWIDQNLYRKDNP